MENQQSEQEAALAWIAGQLGDDEVVDVERTGRFCEQLEEEGLQWDDVWHALRRATGARRDYAGGCITVSGPTIDGGDIEVVVAPPSSKNRLRFIKVWRA